MQWPELSLRPTSQERPSSCTYKKATNPVKTVFIASRAFCKIPQARVLWVGRGDGIFEGQVRSLFEWPQRAQKHHRPVSNPILCLLCFLWLSSFTTFGRQWEPCRERQGRGPSRDQFVLCLNGHKRHKNTHRPVSNPILCLLCFLWLSLLHHSAASGISAGRGKGAGQSRDKSALCCIMEMLDSPSDPGLSVPSPKKWS